MGSRRDVLEQDRGPVAGPRKLRKMMASHHRFQATIFIPTVCQSLCACFPGSFKKEKKDREELYSGASILRKK